MHFTNSFLLAHGHIGNVGDSVLRRHYVDTLVNNSRNITVWPGTHDQGYVDGLIRFGSDVCRVSLAGSYIDWYRQALRHGFSGGTVIALNAGQYTLTRRYMLQALTLIPLVLATRLFGGKVVWLGAAVPEAKLGRTWIYRTLAVWANLVRWRDSASASIVKRGDTMPDWAFRHRGSVEPTENRGEIVISMRGDRAPQSASWIRSMQALGDRTGLKLHVVSQVREDCATARVLADELGAELTIWNEGGHTSQEKIVREIYARARLAVSDRLHVLIMAATEGAAPLAYVESPISKIVRHVDYLGFDWVAPPGGPVSNAIDELDVSTIDSWQERTVRICAEARFQLKAVDQELTALGPAAE